MSSSKGKKDTKKQRDEEEEKEQRRSESKSKKTKETRKKQSKYSSGDEEQVESPDEHTDVGDNESKKRKATNDDPMEEEGKKKQAKPIAPSNDASLAPERKADAPKPPSATINPQDVATVPGRFGALSKAYMGSQMVVHRGNGTGAPVCQHYFDDVLTPENIQKLAFLYVKGGEKSMGEGGCKVGFIEKKDEDDEDGNFTELRFRTPPLEVVEVNHSGVGVQTSTDDNTTTGKLPDDSRRKYTVKVRIGVTPDIAELDPTIEKRQKQFAGTMNGPLMERIKFLLWQNKNIKTGQKSNIRTKYEEEEKEKEKKRVEEGRPPEIADPVARKAAQKAAILAKCISAFADGCQNWVFYEKVFKGKKIPGDDPAGSIFRFKHNVFFPIKDPKKTTQTTNAIVTKKAATILQPVAETNQPVQNASQATDQGQAYKHYNQPPQTQKNEPVQQYDQDDFTVIGDLVFKNEYEERSFDFSDTTPARAWEIYHQYVDVQKSHNYSRITFVDANGAPINLGRDINTKLLKPGDFIELDVKLWVYILNGSMGVRLDFGTPITLVRQGTSSFGMASKHVYASNSGLSAPIVFDEPNKKLDTIVASNIQVPPSPASWDVAAYGHNG